MWELAHACLAQEIGGTVGGRKFKSSVVRDGRTIEAQSAVRFCAAIWRVAKWLNGGHNRSLQLNVRMRPSGEFSRETYQGIRFKVGAAISKTGEPGSIPATPVFK